MTRYFIGNGGEINKWTGNVWTHRNLPNAINNYWNRYFRGIYLAKKIGYKTEIDEKSCTMKVTPVGDFASNEPYYVMDFHCGGEVFVEKYKSFDSIFKKGLPNGLIVAHGLELKLSTK